MMTAKEAARLSKKWNEAIDWVWLESTMAKLDRALGKALATGGCSLTLPLSTERISTATMQRLTTTLADLGYATEYIHDGLLVRW